MFRRGLDMPWIKVATCPLCGKRVKLKRENRLYSHKRKLEHVGISVKCSGSNHSCKDVGWELKPKPA
jgi:hypothetical protein